ncbi:MAG: type II toxin-antitoxin system HicB family antitoxin [Dolichospermum sp.]|jgi:predicted RNase H-like HicB family nuclease|nr:type II toxin-antitoxin system HicB family antitoxin [Anabaena sp. 49628_E55]
MKIKAIIYPAQEGGYWAEVPALPGCITEGDTMEELINNLQDAIQGWLEVANEIQKPDPISQVAESVNEALRFLIRITRENKAIF